MQRGCLTDRSRQRPKDAPSTIAESFFYRRDLFFSSSRHFASTSSMKRSLIPENDLHDAHDLLKITPIFPEPAGG